MTRTIEVAIGLGGTYLFLSIIVLALVEGVSGFFDRRGAHLKEALESMLTKGVATELIKHPLVGSLAAAGSKSGKVKMPSYLGPTMFSQAMTEMIAAGKDAKADLGASYQAFLKAIPNADNREQIRRIVGDTVEDAEQLKARLETWFNNSMDRLSGAYKRHTQRFARGFAAALVLLLNVNTITMAEALWKDPELRAAGVKKAQSLYQRCGEDGKPVPGPAPGPVDVAPQPQPQPQPVGQASDCPELATLTAAELPFPITGRVYDTLFSSGMSFAVTVLGLLLSIWAVSLGAPFWFDTLRKLSGGIQQTGPKPARDDKKSP